MGKLWGEEGVIRASGIACQGSLCVCALPHAQGFIYVVGLGVILVFLYTYT